MSNVKTVITQEKLNEFYTCIHKNFKERKIDKSTKVIYKHENRPIEFIYDSTIGRKGNWILKTNIKIDYPDDDPQP